MDELVDLIHELVDDGEISGMLEDSIERVGDDVRAELASTFNFTGAALGALADMDVQMYFDNRGEWQTVRFTAY